ncbi:MAG: cytochrome C oxidase subunit IV family protein [Bacteriovoracaceae bacterium]|nr:cytochrome C oxidase subunit IV family protein [Bacteriovoracaceae bacterium]
MSGDTHHSHVKEYLIIFVVLAVLTVLELMIPELSVAYSIKASSLVLLAIAKAVVVAQYYMHLKEETKWLKYIAIIPVSAAVYAAVVILESMYR